MLCAVRDLIVGYPKSSSASVNWRGEIFGRANFLPRIISLGILKCILKSGRRRTGEWTEQCRPTERTPRHFILDFSRSNSSVYTDALNLRILLLDNFAKKKRIKSARGFLKIAFWDTVSSKHSLKCFFFLSFDCLFFTFIRTRGVVTS